MMTRMARDHHGARGAEPITSDGPCSMNVWISARKQERSPWTFPVDMVSKSFQELNNNCVHESSTAWAETPTWQKAQRSVSCDAYVAVCEMREVSSVEEGHDVERVSLRRCVCRLELL